MRDTLQSFYYWYKELPSLDPVRVRLARGLPRGGPLSPARLELQLHHLEGLERRLLLRQPVHRLRPLLQANQRHRAAPRPDLPRQPRRRGRARPRRLSPVHRTARRWTISSAPARSHRSSEPSRSASSPTWPGATGRARTRSATLAKRLVTIPTVSQTAVLDAGGSRVGYIHFRNFVAALGRGPERRLHAGPRRRAPPSWSSTCATTGAGSSRWRSTWPGSSPARRSSARSSCSSPTTTSSPAATPPTASRSKPQALALTRLVVIATRGSASASEAIINGLRPYMEVKVVGDATFGKPVGQYGFDFCEKVLYPVSFLVTNARGEADYFGGIPADCAAADDVDHPLASPQEASLAEALYVVRNGRCSGTAAAQAEVQARLARARAADPARRLAPDPERLVASYQLRGFRPSSCRRSSRGFSRSRSPSFTGTRRSAPVEEPRREQHLGGELRLRPKAGGRLERVDLEAAVRARQGEERLRDLPQPVPEGHDRDHALLSRRDLGRDAGVQAQLEAHLDPAAPLHLDEGRHLPGRPRLPSPGPALAGVDHHRVLRPQSSAPSPPPRARAMRRGPGRTGLRERPPRACGPRPAPRAATRARAGW